MSFLLICFLSSTSYSQFSNLPTLQKIDEANGLSDNNIKCVYKDNNGFMWIGTSSGLNLLDGSTITVYKNIPGDINSISNNHINCIISDSSGILWVGNRKGLNSFNPILNRFETIPLQQNNGTKNEAVVSIAIDKKNNLFIATSSGLYYYDQEHKKMSFIELPGDDYEKVLNNNITHIDFDKKSTLWLSTFNGFWSYNENSHQFVHEINSKNDPLFTRLFTNFIIDHSGKFWIGTWDRGLKEFNPKSKNIITHHLPPERDFNISCIAEIKQTDGNNIIFVNSNSLWFDPYQNKFILSETGKDNSTASVLLNSNNKRIWIGTDKGLYYYSLSKTIIHHHKFRKPITDQGISFLGWGNNFLVAGGRENFLKAFDKNLEEKEDFGNRFKGEQFPAFR